MVRDRTDSYVRVFDTTLRDGEQSPGASLTSDEKLILARRIASLGVDVIEAGFPAASPDDLAAVQGIAHQVGADGPIIAGLARACRGDIERAWEAVRMAQRPRIHTFLATSDLHMSCKLDMSRQQVLDRIGEMVAYARSLCDDVQFSPEDATRSDPEFLIQAVRTAIEAGATTLNIPDTVGYALPDEYGELMARLIEESPADVFWSAHCHDDLGLATSNTLSAVRAGARQIEVTVNGIGERAGNTSLEEIVMALATRRPELGMETGIDTRQLTPLSRMVSRFTGMAVPRNKAVVGRNAFAHEAGIHQDGMLKDERTYEIMTPASVGAERSELVLGKHSGRHAFRTRLVELGVELDETKLDEAFRHFKELADRKKTVTDADLMALTREEVGVAEEHFRLGHVQVVCGSPAATTATVRLIGRRGNERVGAAVGSGSVDAVFRAIQKIAEAPNELVDFNIRNVTAGIDALGEVTVRIVPRKQNGEASGQNGSAAGVGNNGHDASAAANVDAFGGYGTDTDVIVASAKAYLAAINRMLSAREAASPAQHSALTATPASARLAAERIAFSRFGAGNEESFDPDYTVGIP
ncbi:MAG: 2-isopropylmalate synthase [Acidobacteriota bacterium]